MKLNNAERFLHPVLTPYTGDYIEQELLFDCDIAEVPFNSTIQITYDLSVSDPDLTEYIRERAITPFLSVVCLESGFSKLFEADMGVGSLEIPGGLLRGRTRIRPLLVSTKRIASFSPRKMHAEYDNRTFDIQIGTVIGFLDEIIIHVGMEKLANMESIFRISKNESLPKGQISVDLENPWIEIMAAPDLYSVIQLLRNNSSYHPVVINSVYMPAVMQILNAIAGSEQDFSHLRWHRIFSAKCEHYGIDASASESLIAAQNLLQSPLSRLEKFVEVTSNES